MKNKHKINFGFAVRIRKLFWHLLMCLLFLFFSSACVQKLDPDLSENLTSLANFANSTGLTKQKEKFQLAYSFDHIEMSMYQTLVDVLPSIEPHGIPVYYTIDKDLPHGLIFKPNNGAIKGTPMVPSPVETYTVTAVGIKEYHGFSSSTKIKIKIKQDSLLSLSYSTTNIRGTVGQKIANIIPILNPNKLDVYYYMYDKTLPQGLRLNKKSGIISGTPLDVSDGIYTITAKERSTYNYVASIQIKIEIQEKQNPTIVALTYPSINIQARVGREVFLEPAIVPAEALMYFVSEKSFPKGILLDPLDGTIKGIPVETGPAQVYAIVGTGRGGYDGSISIPLRIEVLPTTDLGNLTYTTSYIDASLNESIRVSPIFYDSNGPVYYPDPRLSDNNLSFFADKTLPEGLRLHPHKGTISGSSKKAKFREVYTIYAVGRKIYQGAHSSTTIIIEVSIPITEFHYSYCTKQATTSTDATSLAIGTHVMECGSHDVMVLGAVSPLGEIYMAPVLQPRDAKATYKIDRSLPSGVNFNEKTGVITGTQFAVMNAPESYTITLTGTGHYKGVLSTGIAMMLRLAHPYTD